jgi:hypothetical protein
LRAKDIMHDTQFLRFFLRPIPDTKPSPPQPNGTLSLEELRRLVADMVG